MPKKNPNPVISKPKPTKALFDDDDDDDDFLKKPKAKVEKQPIPVITKAPQQPQLPSKPKKGLFDDD